MITRPLPTSFRLVLTTILALAGFALFLPGAPTATADPVTHDAPPIQLRSTVSATARMTTVLVVAKPSRVHPGDLLLARIAARGSVDATVTLPTGWHLIRVDRTADELATWLAWKETGAAEPASYRFRIDGRADLAGTVTAFDHVDTRNPILTHAGQASDASAALTAPATITTAAHGFAVWFGTQTTVRGSRCAAITPPQGFTEVVDDCRQPIPSGLQYEAAYHRLTTAGSQPAQTGTTPRPTANTAQTVVLRPGPSCHCGDDFTAVVNVLGQVTEPSLIEPSGLGASRVNPGVLYVHGEDNPTMIAINAADAAVVGRYSAGVTPWDSEDVAIGPCPSGSCIFLADIGKESGHPGPQPTEFAVYRMREPDLAKGETTGTLAGDRFRFQYPDGAKNAEALVVHPTTGRIYVLTKSNLTGESGVYVFPDNDPEPGSLTTLTHVTTLQVPISDTDNVLGRVTAAAIHPCGDRFLVRTYHAVYEFRAPAGGTFEDTFAAAPIALTDTAERQGESIEYAPDGSGYFTMGEENAPPYRLKFVAQRADRS